MIKIPTGVTYTPKEFRSLNQCVQCGKSDNIPRGSSCEYCFQRNIPHCDICDILLRDGDYDYYTYDIKEISRDGDIKLLASKELVREFVYTETSSNPSNPEMLCVRCVGWEARMLNKCWDCGREFNNSKENYKENGNMCAGCALRYVRETTNVKKIGDDRLAREVVCTGSNEN